MSDNNYDLDYISTEVEEDEFFQPREGRNPAWDKYRDASRSRHMLGWMLRTSFNGTGIRFRLNKNGVPNFFSETCGRVIHVFCPKRGKLLEEKGYKRSETKERESWWDEAYDALQDEDEPK